MKTVTLYGKNINISDTLVNGFPVWLLKSTKVFPLELTGTKAINVVSSCDNNEEQEIRHNFSKTFKGWKIHQIYHIAENDLAILLCDKTHEQILAQSRQKGKE